MANCSMCGIEIPNGQRICSMCYGDPEYGRDGYYREFLSEEYKRELMRQEDEADAIYQEWLEERQSAGN